MQVFHIQELDKWQSNTIGFVGIHLRILFESSNESYLWWIISACYGAVAAAAAAAAAEAVNNVLALIT